MVLLHTPPREEDFTAPDFALPATDGNSYSLNDIAKANGVVIGFVANHCPYVQCILDKLVADIHALHNLNVGVALIAASDIKNYPQDGMKAMQDITSQKNIPCPYLLDESQEVAKAYGAVCTPDFFGFNRDSQLVYRGRLDDSAMAYVNDNPRDLVNAMTQWVEHSQIVSAHPSQGCSIKWK